MNETIPRASGSHIFIALMKDPVLAGAEMAEAANQGDELALDLLKVVTSRRGITLPFLRRIRDAAQEVQLETIPELDESNRKFFWKKSAPDATISLEAAYAMVLIQLINTDLVERLQKCSAEDCEKYYFGTLKQSFCSETCAVRIRARRRRSKQQLQE